MSAIVGEKLVLGTLFGPQYYFQVPDYQRPYAWEKQHAEQLFDDLFNSVRDSEYFLGNIILRESKKQGNTTFYELIDGQQRLTTLQILLACMRDAVNESAFKTTLQDKIFQPANPVDGIPAKVRLEVKDPEFFLKLIQESGSTKTFEPDNKLTDPQRRMVAARDLFKAKLETCKETEIQSLISFVNQYCVMMYLSTKDFDNAYRLFSIINDRGLQLRRIDVLKARNLAPDAILDDHTRRTYARRWEDMEDEMGADEFENLIFMIRLIEAKEKAKFDLLVEFEQIFNRGTMKKGVDFISKIENTLEIYRSIFINEEVFHSEKCMTSTRNLVALMFDHLKPEYFIAAILSYYGKFQMRDFSRFIELLELKTRTDWVLSVSKDRRLVNICSILKAIEEAKEPKELFSKQVFSFDRSAYEKELRSEYFYTKEYCRYVLLRLELFYSDNSVRLGFENVTVEHVLPQTPSDDSQWCILFNEQTRERWTNSIANLILLNRRKNSAASNYEFEEKKKKYFQGRMSCFPRSNLIIGQNVWNMDVLQARENELVEKLTTA